MATTKKTLVKKTAKRNEVVIRVSDIPEKLFNAITKNATAERRSNGKEVLTFLEQNNYQLRK